MNIEVSLFGDFMRKCFRQGVTLGITEAESAEEFFGFEARDVAALYFHKMGYGEGAWFRLRDGRIYDRFARADDPDPLGYDQYTH